MAASMRHALRDAVETALSGAPGLDGVTIAVGREPHNVWEYVWLFPRLSAKREFKVLGKQPPELEEKPKLMLRVVVIAHDPDAAETRCLELAEAAEGVLRLLSLPKPFLESVLIEEVEDEPQDFDGKAGHEVWMTVTTKARI